jgi:hypothetical protein
MRTKGCTTIVATLLATGALASGTARADYPPQTAEQRQKTVELLEGLKSIVDEVDEITKDQPIRILDLDAVENATSALSAGARQAIGLARSVDQIREAVEHGGKDLERDRQRFANNAAIPAFSRFGGFTQNETSTAWCGSNAAIGFNDSGALMATLFTGVSPSSSLSFNGYAFSHDSGERFTQGPPLLPDPMPAGVDRRMLLGDPVIACSSSRSFYYASLDYDFDCTHYISPWTHKPLCRPLKTAISVSISTDGGRSFSKTITAAGKDPFQHFLDKEWMAVVPGPRGDILHITYTDFDWSDWRKFYRDHVPTTCPLDSSGRPQFRTAIEHVRSTDGGATWSQPDVIEQSCSNDAYVQGSRVEANGNDVYAAWETYRSLEPLYIGDETIRAIKTRGSSDGGKSFGAAVTISAVTAPGDGQKLQGGFRSSLDMQALAIDPSSGAVYVAWQAGRKPQVDLSTETCRSGRWTLNVYPQLCQYAFGDVLLSSSTDKGATWSAPVRVNDDPINLAVDHFFPTLTVDRRGTVYVAFYDRRGDAQNRLIDTYLARSEDGGRSFSNSRLTERPFAPLTCWADRWVAVTYMGDYISVAADSTRRSEGVISSWGDMSLGSANVAYFKYEGEREGREVHHKSKRVERE